MKIQLAEREKGDTNTHWTVHQRTMQMKNLRVDWSIGTSKMICLSLHNLHSSNWQTCTEIKTARFQYLWQIVRTSKMQYLQFQQANNNSTLYIQYLYRRCRNVWSSIAIFWWIGWCAAMIYIGFFSLWALKQIRRKKKAMYIWSSCNNERNMCQVFFFFLKRKRDNQNVIEEQKLIEFCL